jgi:hypothetical protein
MGWNNPFDEQEGKRLRRGMEGDGMNKWMNKIRFSAWAKVCFRGSGKTTRKVEIEQT